MVNNKVKNKTIYHKPSTTNQFGAIPPLVLFAALGLVIFLLITSTVSFKDQLFGELFPKPASKAFEDEIVFIDDAGEAITESYSNEVRVRIKSLWPPLPQSPTPTPSSTPSPAPSETPMETSTPSPSPSGDEPQIYTKEIIISELSTFDENDSIVFDYINCDPQVSGQINCVDANGYFITEYTFSGSDFGDKALFVKFVPDDETVSPETAFATIELIDPDATPTPSSSSTPSPSNTSSPTPRVTPTPTPLPTIQATPTFTPSPAPPESIPPRPTPKPTAPSKTPDALNNFNMPSQNISPSPIPVKFERSATDSVEPRVSVINELQNRLRKIMREVLDYITKLLPK